MVSKVFPSDETINKGDYVEVFSNGKIKKLRLSNSSFSITPLARTVTTDLCTVLSNQANFSRTMQTKNVGPNRFLMAFIDQNNSQKLTIRLIDTTANTHVVVATFATSFSSGSFELMEINKSQYAVFAANGQTASTFVLTVSGDTMTASTHQTTATIPSSGYGLNGITIDQIEPALYLVTAACYDGNGYQSNKIFLVSLNTSNNTFSFGPITGIGPRVGTTGSAVKLGDDNLILYLPNQGTYTSASFFSYSGVTLTLANPSPGITGNFGSPYKLLLKKLNSKYLLLTNSNVAFSLRLISFKSAGNTIDSERVIEFPGIGNAQGGELIHIKGNIYGFLFAESRGNQYLLPIEINGDAVKVGRPQIIYSDQAVDPYVSGGSYSSSIDINGKIFSVSLSDRSAGNFYIRKIATNIGQIGAFEGVPIPLGIAQSGNKVVLDGIAEVQGVRPGQYYKLTNQGEYVPAEPEENVIGIGVSPGKLKIIR